MLCNDAQTLSLQNDIVRGLSKDISGVAAMPCKIKSSRELHRRRAFFVDSL
jgi:hypothetical protein